MKLVSLAGYAVEGNVHMAQLPQAFARRKFQSVRDGSVISSGCFDAGSPSKAVAHETRWFSHEVRVRVRVRAPCSRRPKTLNV